MARTTLSDQLAEFQRENHAMETELVRLRMQVETDSALIASQAEKLRQLRVLPEQLAKMQKEIASEKSSKEYYSRQNDEARKELEDVHTVLDVIPGALPRKDPTDQYGRTYSVTLRLTVYLANQGKITGATHG